MATQSIQLYNEAYMSLMKGLKELHLPSECVPCDLLLTGDHAFPLAINSQGQVLMAASQYGRGRIVVLGHEGYLTPFPALIENALTWLRGDGSDNVSVGIHKHVRAVADNLRKSSFQAKVVEAFSNNLGIGVYVTDAYSVGEDPKDLVAFLKAGGGVLIGGQAWNWAAHHPKENVLLHFSGNKVSGVAGIYFSDIYGKVENLPVYPQIPSSWKTLKVGKDFQGDLEFLLKGISEFELRTKEGIVASEILVHGPLAFPIGTTEDGRAFLAGAYYGKGRVVLISHEGVLGEETKFRKDLSVFVCTAYSDEHVKEIQDFVAEGGGLLIGGHAWWWAHTHCGQNPLKDFSGNKILNKMGLSLLVTTIDEGSYKALLPFLKNKPQRPVVHNRKIRVNANTAENEVWISTGLYISPGLKTYMITPAEITNKGWKIQIGCQTDFLTANELKRAPCVSVDFPITSERMQVWNLWGGLIYLVAPPNTKVNGVEVIVEKAVSAPYYQSGKTTAADWSSLRTAPAPWAELEFENIIITVPSEFVRSLDRPDKLAAHWDKIMRSIADLAAIPHKFPRKERIAQESSTAQTAFTFHLGWMHSGYPIMGHTPTAAELVNVDIAKIKDMWGPIHELGHNQQRSCWEFRPHTTECTCNLWSVYVHEEVLGINRAQAHPEMTLTNRKKRTEEYVRGGRNLKNWYIWVALETYMQVQEKFGWDAFKKVFAAYHQMSNFPNHNKGKMNLYAETFSQTVGMNLCGFLKSWGWPIEESTEDKLSNLPPWTDHPMVQYG
ncbi:hypothetical protein Q5P01_009917 [Channa striata]|uniref:Peptidase M60 domain-containing protein n=1 Tax=Channa striata TaxID=64152 RepID=A0AA88N0H0_CHASR|nr:hypothetical protein Q5P01_009917 [Channa striata]